MMLRLARSATRFTLPKHFLRKLPHLATTKKEQFSTLLPPPPPPPPPPYPSALTAVGQLLRSSQGALRSAPGIQSALVWILRTCSTPELCQIMNGTVARRIDKLPPFNRKPKPLPLLIQIFRLLKKDSTAYDHALYLLSVDRLCELDLNSKCALVKALQLSSGRNNVLSEDEHAVVVRLFKSVTDGAELQIFKNMLNDVGNKYNLHQLMFQTVAQPWRDTILSYFESQVAGQSSNTRKPIKVLSDIDDTLFSSWLDKRWPREIVYPGVRTFFIELTRNNHGNGNGNGNSGVSGTDTTSNGNIETLSSILTHVEQLIVECQQEDALLQSTTATTPTARTMQQQEEQQKDEHLLVDRFRFLREKSLSVWIHEDEEDEDEISTDISEDIDFDEFHTTTNKVVTVNHPVATAVVGTAPTADKTNTTTTTAASSPAPLAPLAPLAPPIPLSSAPSSSVTTLEDVTYITARPHGYRGVVAALTRRRLRLAGLSEKPQVMLGDISGLLGNKRIAQKKFTNFCEFKLLYPEYNFVLVGDTGQGDALLGKLIFQHFPDQLKGVFLHNISTNEKTGDGGEKSTYTRDMNFHFFKTYIGSATSAYKHHLIDGHGLVLTASATLEEFSLKNFSNSIKGNQQRHERLHDLHRDLMVAKECLLESQSQSQ